MKATDFDYVLDYDECLRDPNNPTMRDVDDANVDALYCRNCTTPFPVNAHDNGHGRGMIWECPCGKSTIVIDKRRREALGWVEILEA